MYENDLKSMNIPLVYLEIMPLAVEEMPATATINTRASSPDLLYEHPAAGTAFPTFPPSHDYQLAVIGNHRHPVLAGVTFPILAPVRVPAFAAPTACDPLALWTSGPGPGPVFHRDEATTKLAVAIKPVSGPCLELF